MSKMKRILKKIAKENNVSVDEVKREIEKSIALCYESPNERAQAVPRENAIPTIEEFITYMASQIR